MKINTKEMSGKKYGRLTVVNECKYKNKHRGMTMVHCKCDCGNELDIVASSVKSGHSKSCNHCNKYIKYKRYVKCIVRNGKSFIFDIDDYDLVKKHCWSIGKDNYVRSGDRKLKSDKLHLLILKKKKGLFIDHINGNPCDCRKCNLRYATKKQNAHNYKKPITNTSGYKGVSYYKKRKIYSAYIYNNNKKIFLGYFNNPIEAAKAYDKAAILLFGEFAKTNFERRNYG